eukprot:5828323-Amphidinium_carterae.1
MEEAISRTQEHELGCQNRDVGMQFSLWQINGKLRLVVTALSKPSLLNGCKQTFQVLLTIPRQFGNAVQALDSIAARVMLATDAT